MVTGTQDMTDEGGKKRSLPDPRTAVATTGHGRTTGGGRQRGAYKDLKSVAKLPTGLKGLFHSVHALKTSKTLSFQTIFPFLE